MPGWSVVGAGAASVDDLVFVDSALADGKGRVVRRERRFGGNALAALVAVAAHGVSAAFIGCLPDETGDAGLLAYLRAAGVDVSPARRCAATAPIHSTIVIDPAGERFVAYDDATILGAPPDLDLSLVTQARVLLLDRYGLDGGTRAAAAARAAGTAVVADFERPEERALKPLVALVDHLVVPLGFAVRWTRTSTAEQAVDALWSAGRAAVVVTDGANGVWFRAAGDRSVHHHPAAVVPIVDTTGCGDVFHGVYAAALALGAGVRESVAAAADAAAECATRPGAAPSQPASVVPAERTSSHASTTRAAIAASARRPYARGS
jgi:sulfofructose kinase